MHPSSGASRLCGLGSAPQVLHDEPHLDRLRACQGWHLRGPPAQDGVACGAAPVFADAAVVVAAVEAELVRRLDALGLGRPLRAPMSAAQVYAEVTSHQGVLWCGEEAAAIEAVVEKVAAAVAAAM